MSKQDRINIQKSNHAAWLIKLGADQDQAQRGKTYNQLRSIERSMNVHNDRYASEVDYPVGALDRAIETATKMVAELFGGKLPEGFFINTDPRGYALKINDDVMRAHRDDWGNPHRDMGGYGILAPEFN